MGATRNPARRGRPQRCIPVLRRRGEPRPHYAVRDGVRDTHTDADRDVGRQSDRVSHPAVWTTPSLANAHYGVEPSVRVRGHPGAWTVRRVGPSASLHSNARRGNARRGRSTISSSPWSARRHRSAAREASTAAHLHLSVRRHRPGIHAAASVNPRPRSIGRMTRSGPRTMTRGPDR